MAGKKVTWRERSIDGLRFRWNQSDRLYVELESDASGWVLVGFNDKATLAGSRLFMANIVKGTVTVEEHLADPPTHAAISNQSAIRDVSGAESSGKTIVRFSIPNENLGRNVTLAWSRHDDLQHHSALRQMITIDF